MSSSASRVLIWLCLTVVIITPFSNDVFISSFPIMKEVFYVRHIGLVMGVYLAGLAISQLFYGPLSDYFGRKPVLQVGLCIFLIGSGLLLITDSFLIFLLGRFFQAIGAASAVISVLAILCDTYQDIELVRSIGIVMAIIGLSPAVAPMIGSVLTTFFSWRASCYLLFMLGIVYLVITSLFLKVTDQKRHVGPLKLKPLIANYGIVITSKRYRYYCLSAALAYGVLFTYVSLSPTYIVELFHFSLVYFGWMALILGCLMFASSLITKYFVKHLGLAKTVFVGTMIMALGGVCMVLANLFVGANIYTFLVPMIVVIIGVGLIRTSASSGAISQADHKTSGTAAAGFGFIIFIGGSLCSSFSGFLDKTPLYLSVFIVILGVIVIRIAWLNIHA